MKLKLLFCMLIALMTSFLLTGCKKNYNHVLNYFNESKIIKVEYVEGKKDVKGVVLEEYISLDIQDLDAYIAELNNLECKSVPFKDYYWEGSGDIKFYYEDGSTLKWDGTKIKYTDQNGTESTKFFENNRIWDISSKYAGIHLNLKTIVRNNDTFVLSKINTNWLSENSNVSLSFSEATSHAYTVDNEINETTSTIDNITHIRLEASELDIIESALGSIKYKDSLINIKLIFSRINGSNDYIHADLYYMSTENGEQHPVLGENNLIANCLISFHNEQLQLISTNSGIKGDGSKLIDENFVDVFGNDEIFLNKL